MLTLSNTHSFKTMQLQRANTVSTLQKHCPKKTMRTDDASGHLQGKYGERSEKLPCIQVGIPSHSNPDLLIMTVSVKILHYNINNFIILYKTIIIQHYYVTDLILSCTGEEVQPPANEHQG